MFFTQIQTLQFRNLSSDAIPVGQRQVLLIGENGQGKTNFLEAVYSLCYGSSFRTPDTKEMITQGKDGFRLSGSFVDDETMSHDISFVFKDGKRAITLDERTIMDRKELIYTMPCIVFSHDDIWFVNGEPEQRRRFFDQTMSLYDPLFFDDLRRYRMVLRQRNQAVKDRREDLLSIYDLQLAQYGVAIQRERTKAVYEFNQIFPGLYQKVSGETWNITISYRPSWDDCATDTEVIDVLNQTRERDFILQTTSSGIHRDRFVILCDDSPFADVGSTGQLRLASLLFRVAQMRFFTLKTGKRPIILVDDVLLELDHKKRDRFLDMIDGYDQAFFTFLPDEQYFSVLPSRQSIIYDVKDGRFTGRA